MLFLQFISPGHDCKPKSSDSKLIPVWLDLPFFLTTPKLPEKMGTTIGQQILSVAATVGQAAPQ